MRLLPGLGIAHYARVRSQMTMLDHVVLNVSDAAVSRAFYEEALEPLGITVLADHPGFIGFGRDGIPFFWIAERVPVGRGTHVALHCADRATVEAFHGAAMSAGGADNGAPGIREIYHSDYYGAFVLDPDGNNIEAVCHQAE